MSFDLETGDLMDRLRDDPMGRVRDYALEEVMAKKMAVKRHLDRGVAPQEFQSLNQVLGALEEAEMVIDKVWKHLNETAA